MRVRACLWLVTAALLTVACSKKEEAPAAPEPSAAEPAAPAAPKREGTKYDTGASDTEIKIGQIMPYSGPASAYGTIGRTQAAYFKRLNENGGINGRKINFISVDDMYSPPKAVEQTRKLVEQDEVLLVFQPLGTPSNTAIQKYLNSKQVPQLFVSSGATKWGDPKNFPWTIGFNPSYQLEAKTYAAHILKHHPKGKIAVLYQNDDFGKDYLTGLKEGLGDKAAKMIVKEVTYEVTDATIDSQMAALKASKADIFLNVSTPKFAAQAIRKAFDSGWKPKQYLTNVSTSVGAVLTPAGPEKAAGAITMGYLKDPTDPQYGTDPAMKEYTEFLTKYNPEAKVIDGTNLYGYVAAQTLEHVLKACGDDLTRANIMKQAANLKDFAPGLLLNGVKINTSPDDFFLFDTLLLNKFNGKNWETIPDNS